METTLKNGYVFRCGFLNGTTPENSRGGSRATVLSGIVISAFLCHPPLFETEPFVKKKISIVVAFGDFFPTITQYIFF